MSTTAVLDVALTVEEAARALRIGRTNMYALIKDGSVRTIKVFGSRRVPVCALNEYVSKQLNADNFEGVRN